MSQTPSQPGTTFDATERRQFRRHPIKSLAYLDIGPDNGGIVLNISQGGLAVHAVGVLPTEPEIGLRIQLPKSTKRLEAKGKIAWTSGSKKDAGVEFVDLPEHARLEIEEWLFSESEPDPVPVGEDAEPQSEPNPPPKKRTDKWTNLVAELTSQGATVKQESAAPHADDPVRASAMPWPESPDLPHSPLPSATEPIIAGGELAAEKRNENTQAVEALASELFEPAVDRGIASEYRGEVHRPRNPELSLPSDTLLNTPLQPFTVLPGGEKSKPANRSTNVPKPVAGAPPTDDFLAKARALFSVKRVRQSELESTDPLPVIDAKTEPTSGRELRSDVAEARILPNLQSEPDATFSPASAEIPFVQDAISGETTRKTWLPDSRQAQVKSQNASRASSRSFELRDTLGILALCLVLAVACLGVGIAVGRRSTKQASNASGTAAAIAMLGTASPANNTQDPPAGNPAVPPGGSSTKRHADFRARRVAGPTAARSADVDPRVAADASGTPSAASRDEKSNAGTPADGSEAAPAATNPAPAAAENSEAAPNRASLPKDARSSLPDTGGVSPNSIDATTPARPLPDRLVPAHVIYRVEPFYPRAALEQQVEGTVRIHVTVDKDGRVRNLKVVSGPAPLTSAAVDAAQYWRYIPSLRNGEPIETEEEINIEFHLQH